VNVIIRLEVEDSKDVDIDYTFTIKDLGTGAEFCKKMAHETVDLFFKVITTGKVQQTSNRVPTEVVDGKELVYIFNTKEEAESFIASIMEMYHIYGFVTLSDIRDLVCISTRFQNVKYGWTVFDELTPKLHKHGYGVTLPIPKPLDDHRPGGYPPPIKIKYEKGGSL